MLSLDVEKTRSRWHALVPTASFSLPTPNLYIKGNARQYNPDNDYPFQQLPFTLL
jgi:hypothetical protein